MNLDDKFIEILIQINNFIIINKIIQIDIDLSSKENSLLFDNNIYNSYNIIFNEKKINDIMKIDLLYIIIIINSFLKLYLRKLRNSIII